MSGRFSIPRGRSPEAVYPAVPYSQTKEGAEFARAQIQAKTDEFFNVAVPELMGLRVPAEFGGGSLLNHDNEPITTWEEHREAILRYWPYRITGNGESVFDAVYKRINSNKVAGLSRFWRKEQLTKANAELSVRKGFQPIEDLNKKIKSL